MASTTPPHIRRNESDWRAIMAAFAASNLSQKAFCEREGLALSAFRYWKSRLGVQPTSPAETPAPTDTASAIDLGTLEDRPRGLGGRDRLGRWCIADVAPALMFFPQSQVRVWLYAAATE